MKSIKKYLQEGGALFEEGKYEQALEIIDEAVALYPEDYDAHMNRKLLLTKLGYYEEMLECSKTCKRLKSLETSKCSMDGYIKEWNAYYIIHEHHDALRVINEATSEHPNNAAAYFHKGVTLNELTKHKEALICFEQAIKIDPYYVEAHHRKYYTLAVLSNNKIIQSLEASHD